MLQKDRTFKYLGAVKQIRKNARFSHLPYLDEFLSHGGFLNRIIPLLLCTYTINAIVFQNLIQIANISTNNPHFFVIFVAMGDRGSGLHPHKFTSRDFQVVVVAA